MWHSTLHNATHSSQFDHELKKITVQSNVDCISPMRRNMRNICERSREKNFTINFPARFRVYLTKWRYSLSSCAPFAFQLTHTSSLPLYLSLSLSIFFAPIFFSSLFNFIIQVLVWSFAENIKTLNAFIRFTSRIQIIHCSHLNQWASIFDDSVFVLVCCSATATSITLLFFFFLFTIILLLFRYVWECVISLQWNCKESWAITISMEIIELIIKKSTFYCKLAWKLSN